MILTLAALVVLNRSINALPMENRPLAFAAEGRPFYDCKGAVKLKLERLEALGEPDTAMRILVVNCSATMCHAVLQLDDHVLDNLSPWLEGPREYIVQRSMTPAEFKAWWQAGL